MRYNKDKLLDIIERLQSLIETDYITYPSSDDKKVEEILNNLESEVDKWWEMHNDNFSF